MKREAVWGGGIRRLRVREGFTQEALAEEIDMTCETVSRIECGARWNEDTYTSICTALGVDDSAVVTCAETLERELLSAVDERHLAGAIVPTLNHFTPGQGEHTCSWRRHRRDATFRPVRSFLRWICTQVPSTGGVTTWLPMGTPRLPG